MSTLITAVLVHNLGMCLFDQRRHHSQRRQIHRPKKAALIMTYADNSPEKEGVIINHYNVLLNYLGWQDAGQIIAPGVWPVGAVNHTALFFRKANLILMPNTSPENHTSPT